MYVVVLQDIVTDNEIRMAWVIVEDAVVTLSQVDVSGGDSRLRKRPEVLVLGLDSKRPSKYTRKDQT